MDTYTRLYRKIPTELLKGFLCSQNINAVQDEIINRIRNQTNISISRQSEHELLGYMYNIYDIYGDDVCDTRDVLDKLRDINGKLIDACVVNIKHGILTYTQYLKDASNMPTPIPRSVSTTIDKSLEYTKSNIVRTGFW
jgi:hypothetical protein